MSYPVDKLGKHIQILSGFAFKSKDFSESGVPVIKIKNVTPPSVSLIDLSYVSHDIANQNSKYILKYDDVLIALTGSHINQMASVVGRVARVKYKDKTVLNQRVAKITVTDENDCDLDYVYYYLSQDTVKIELASKAGGAANQANISPTDIKNLSIPFPNIQVQRQISSVLKAYDNLIENNQKQIKLLEEAAQRLYKEWFVDLRFPGYENTPIVDGIPQGWTEQTIADLCEKINAGGTPNRKNANYWNNAAIKWYKTQELQDCWLIDSDEKISEDGYDNSSAKIFPETTILMAIYASPTLGRLGVLDSEASCNQAALCLKADETKISWQWLYETLFSLREQYNKIARGAGQQNISGEVVKQTNVVCPSAYIMNKFTQIIAPCFEKRRILQKQIIILREARDRLLPKLMSGEIEV